MVRKAKETASPDESAMLDAVCGSAHKIWQAGLGAFAKAQQEGGEVFEKLVQDGVELQKLTQRLTDDKGFSVTDTVTRLAESASKQASGSWEKLEKIFEDRVSRSLRSLGVPSQQELATLSDEMADLKASMHSAGERSQDQINALSRGIAELKNALASARGIAARRPAAKAAKTAAKPPAKAVKAAKAPAKAAAKRTSVKSAAAKKPARSAARAA